MRVRNEESNIFFGVLSQSLSLMLELIKTAISIPDIVHILIVCNGRPPSKKLLDWSRENADLLIAADGGTNTVQLFGTDPDISIGDMDSFSPDGTESFEVITNTDQETNDLEKALQLAATKQARRVTVLGATGLRLDHTLKNLSVLKQFNAKFEDLVFRDEFGSTRLLPKSFMATLAVGTVVSLFPLSGSVTGITTRGLKYPLKNETLENGVRDGSSNEVIAEKVSITHKTGDLLLFASDQKHGQHS